MTKAGDDSTNTAPADGSLTDAERTKLYLDAWKQTVEVQKHFNDLEWRIRGLALTAATFALGASALAARERTTVGPVSAGSVVLLAGLLLWYAFYFADRYWYHPLLIASVRHGEQLEAELRTNLPRVGLTHDISAGSPAEPPALWFWRKETLRSSDKLHYFYAIGGLVLVAAAVLLQLTVYFSSPSAQPKTPEGACCCRQPPSSSPVAPSHSPSITTPSLTPTSNAVSSTREPPAIPPSPAAPSSWPSK